MRKLVAALLLFVLWAGIICAPLGAEPVISEQIRYYHIVGNTVQDLRQADEL